MSEAWRDPGSYAMRVYDGPSSAHASIAKFFTDGAHASDELVMVSRRATFDSVAALLASGGYGAPVASGRMHFIDSETALPRSSDSGELDLPRSRMFFARLLEDIRRRCGNGTIRLFGDAADMLGDRGLPGAGLQFEELAAQLFRIEPRLSILCGHCRANTPDRFDACSRYAGTQGGGSYSEDGQSPPRVSHRSDEPPPAAVYVIDDDASIRRALSRLLKLGAWQVRTFESAEAFLADLESLSPGCLVLDIQLGGMSGLDLLAHMKHARPGWPIVAMSGSDNDSAETEALRLGARTFLRKPFDSELLIDAITQALA